MRHIAVRGVSVNARSCECGSVLGSNFTDDGGRHWAKCQDDTASEEDWLEGFRLLHDQSVESYDRLASENTAEGPVATARLLNEGL